MVTALHQKLRRDLQRLWLQAAAGGTVLACGIALFVMATGMYASLDAACKAYYDSSRLAHLTASVVRAPDSVAKSLLDTPGVAALETRVVGFGRLDLPGVDEPVTVTLSSLPSNRRPTVNDVVLNQGRWPDRHRSDEALVNEAFADANQLQPGARIAVLMRGEQRSVTIVGIASSPEFVFAVAPGNILPEPRRFGVLWMDHDALAHALDLDGAFNDVVLRLSDTADRSAVVSTIDAVLAPFGGRGLYGRDRMLSARYLSDELSQLKTLAGILPPIFLSVAVFLINAMLSRLVGAERANIGLLKAFGYRNAAIGRHYVEFALAIALFGALLGLSIGTFAGGYMANIYRTVYHLPALEFHASALVHAESLAIAFMAAAAGAMAAVRRAARLAPAEALSPPTPSAFRRLGERLEHRLRSITGRSRMLLRRILRFPRRTSTTVAGIACALALLIMSEHFPIAVDRVIDMNFGIAQRMHVTLTFVERQSEAALRAVARLPGVLDVEPLIAADVFFSKQHRRERDTILGYPPHAVLNRLVDTDYRIVQPDESGVTLSTGLAAKLGATVGDRIRVQSTEGHRTITDATVTAIVQPFLGAGAYTDQRFIARLLREPGTVNGAHLLIDAAGRHALNDRLKELPSVVGATYTDNFERSLRTMFREGVGFFSNMFLVFSLAMAAGVAFSAARITLDEQRRDLATLRVLGYDRGQTSWVLLGELSALLLVALPTGLCLGAALSNWMMHQFETELFAFPFIFDAATYARCASVVSLAVIAATLWVRREIDRLDLVSALKSHE